MLQICINFGANLAPKLEIIDAETAPSSGAIWEEFKKQHYNQSMIRSTIFNARFVLFHANKVQIYCNFLSSLCVLLKGVLMNNCYNLHYNIRSEPMHIFSEWQLP